MLEILANLAEILAGTAIVVSVVRLWPVLGDLKQLRHRVRPKAAQLQQIRRQLNALEDFECPEISSIDAVRDALLAALIVSRSSDLHISKELRDGLEAITVRFRIAGKRSYVCTIPDGLYDALIESFRKIGVPEQPTFERVQIRLPDHPQMDGRVNLQQTTDGPYFVLRLLDPRSSTLPLELLGMPSRVSDPVNEMIDNAHSRTGMVVFAGPMGSGKSVVAYTYISRLMNHDVEIATIEDPVEIDVPGLAQLQVLDVDGLRFRDRLLAAERMDLDALVVGEIRDVETARASFRFASTGLLLTTMASEDFASSLILLHRFDAEELWRGNARHLIQNQRLARRLCQHCKQAYSPSDEDEALIDSILAVNRLTRDDIRQKYSRPVGCDQCQDGYSGPAALYESSFATHEMEKVLRTSGTKSFADIRAVVRGLAVDAGMKTFTFHGLERAAAGDLSFEELRRMLPYGEA